MKNENSNRGIVALALISLLILFSGCGPAMQAGGDIAQGRQAMFAGNYQAALGYFQSAEQTDPNYIWGTELRAGVLSYVGRAQYLSGQLAPGRDSLQKALVQMKSDNVARLYLGLTLARQGDRQAGLRDIEAGMKGISAFLNYITTTFGSTWGQFWDPAQSIRKAINNSLTMVAGGNFDWGMLLSQGEQIAINIEQEPDRASQQEDQQLQMNFGK